MIKIGCIFTLSAVALLAQNDSASLSGRVLDPSGLGIAAAQLTLVAKATGARRTSTSQAGGVYRIDLLPPGDYSLNVTAPGFKVFDDQNLHLQVAQSSSFDISMTLGAVTESVEVSSQVSQLEAASIAQGTVISAEKVKALPLNGRQFLQLALLSPAPIAAVSPCSRIPCARVRSAVSA